MNIRQDIQDVKRLSSSIIFSYLLQKRDYFAIHYLIKIKIMKHLTLISLIIFFISIFIFQSCDNSSVSNGSDTTDLIITQNDAELIAMKHIYLENDQYKLELSKEKALKLGITTKQYTQLIQDIAELNLQIEEIKRKNDSNHELILGDFTKSDISHSAFTRMQTREEIFGLHNVASGQSSFRVDIPRGVSSINVSASSPCAFGLVTVTINGFSKTFSNFSDAANFSIPLSPSSVSITVSTTCSGGATIGYNYQAN